MARNAAEREGCAKRNSGHASGNANTCRSGSAVTLIFNSLVTWRTPVNNIAPKTPAIDQGGTHFCIIQKARRAKWQTDSRTILF